LNLFSELGISLLILLLHHCSVNSFAHQFAVFAFARLPAAGPCFPSKRQRYPVKSWKLSLISDVPVPVSSRGQLLRCLTQPRTRTLGDSVRRSVFIGQAIFDSSNLRCPSDNFYSSHKTAKIGQFMQEGLPRQLCRSQKVKENAASSLLGLSPLPRDESIFKRNSLECPY
jgi:hypothetical protein